MTKLFSPTQGTGFTFCRTAVGSSDFGLDDDSYAEVEGDYQMKHFSLKREKRVLYHIFKKHNSKK
ncbi:beta-glycosidase [Thermophagus xiamenensis]|uniref:Glucosylceramidase n=1 Tax=Thermophagus xiamenensis TaxID=385682 RepID=A0A1I1VYC7_9BACT|nr:beta-glycosidase [Thermophagus xiamenensis]SFD87901.1 glucosylceramidase [Thermophagus xiamenensis]